MEPTNGRRTPARLACRLAKAMAMFCVRNTGLEKFHAGLVPVTRTGDYSDVTVIDADGRRIPWPEVSHFDDDAMRDLMRQVVDRLYNSQEFAEDPRLLRLMERWSTVTRHWDEPKMARASGPCRGNPVIAGRRNRHGTNRARRRQCLRRAGRRKTRWCPWSQPRFQPGRG